MLVFGMNVFDAMSGAVFKALAAVRALTVIDDGNVVHQVDSARRTVAFPLAAGDTARRALIHHVLAPALRRTRHVNSC